MRTATHTLGDSIRTTTNMVRGRMLAWTAQSTLAGGSTGVGTDTEQIHGRMVRHIPASGRKTRWTERACSLKGTVRSIQALGCATRYVNANSKGVYTMGSLEMAASMSVVTLLALFSPSLIRLALLPSNTERVRMHGKMGQSTSGRGCMVERRDRAFTYTRTDPSTLGDGPTTRCTWNACEVLAT